MEYQDSSVGDSSLRFLCTLLLVTASIAALVVVFSQTGFPLQAMGDAQSRIAEDLPKPPEIEEQVSEVPNEMD
jgi:hypothetical protein